MVLSDGDGNPRLYIDNAGLVTAPGGFAGAGGTVTFNNRTAAYTVVAGDLGKVVNCTAGTFTVSLTAAATLGSGFACSVWNTGTGVITIDPNGAETIDGVPTLVLRPGEGTQIVCNGTNWETGNKKTMRQYAENTSAAPGRPTASADGTVAIGQNSNATQLFCIAFGATTSSTGVATAAIGAISAATGNYGFSAGYAASAGGTASIAIGAQNSYGSPTASAFDSIAIGDGCNAAGSFSMAIGAAASAPTGGKFAWSNYRLTTNGDSQLGMIVLRTRTTAAVGNQLTTDANAAGANNQLIVPSNTAISFTGTVVARQQAAGGTQSAAWTVQGLIRREAGVATTTLVASTVSVISNVPGWTLTLSPDLANGALSVTGTGAAATNVQWVATLQTSECTYA